MVCPGDGSPAEAEAMVLPFTPDEALVVDVTRGLDISNMMSSCSRPIVSASTGRKAMLSARYGRVCVFPVLGARRVAEVCSGRVRFRGGV